MRNFLGINWKVRVRNPQFWLSVVLSFIVPPLAYAGIEFNEVTTWGKFFSVLGSGFANPYVVAMIIVSLYNSIVDKTTRGFGDTKIAKQYLRPRTDYDPKQALDWEINVDKKAQAKAQAQKEQQEEQQPSKSNEVAKTSADEHTEGNEQLEPVKYESNEQDNEQDLKAQIGITQPKEYDTTEPFTDDSDEVNFDVAEYEDDEELPRGASKFHDDDVLKVSDEDDSKTD